MQMRKKITLYTFALLGMIVLLNSCKKDYESIETIDDAKIQAYIKQNNLTVTKDPSGFYYQVITQGTGTPLLNKDSVFFNLNVGSLTGAKYYATPSFATEGTYLGYITPSSYRIALTGLNRGGKVRVILPSYLAYGKNGSGTIPSNEIISTEITVYPEEKQWQVDDRFIREFLTSKSITNAVKSPSRVYYQVLNLGTGTSVDISSTLTVKYTGRKLDGTVFDQTTGDATLNSPLTSLIRGWRVLLGMQKGAKVRIFVPSDLAYGTTGQGSIAPNSVLDFDIELVDVTN